jgi:Xaa-Pro dipeptidase
MIDVAAIQKSLRDFGLDGWLFYDFRGTNVLARRVLGLDQIPPGTRRFFYFVPTSGESWYTGSKPQRSISYRAKRRFT